ncbi:MAG: Uncharacterised protein [Hyphomonas sp. TMED17]|nr:MAG: Uncharacterised protein [Hyphomonas sp. TMED17]
MFGWCMWQIMHCEVGIERVNSCRIGCPGSPRGMVGSTVAVSPSRPYSAQIEL